MVKIGDIVLYTTVFNEVMPAQITYIYDGEKHGICQLYITALKQYFDYPINELIT